MQELNQFSRTAQLISSDAVNKLQNSHVAVFGVGGVGGYVIEALVRTGIGSITIVDNDTVSLTNLNRQIVALHSTIGKLKVDVMAERALDINPDVKLTKKALYYNEDTKNEFNIGDYDYVVDAIDSVTSKLLLIEECKKIDTQIISSMGTGNLFNPQSFIVDDIYKTSVCPLARVMRHELRKRNIDHLKVIYSTEERSVLENGIEKKGNGYAPASIAFTPSSAGLLIASEVVKDLIK